MFAISFPYAHKVGRRQEKNMEPHPKLVFELHRQLQISLGCGSISYSFDDYPSYLIRIPLENFSIVHLVVIRLGIR